LPIDLKAHHVEIDEADGLPGFAIFRITVAPMLFMLAPTNAVAMASGAAVGQVCHD
jgi:hypothetical protein